MRVGDAIALVVVTIVAMFARVGGLIVFWFRAGINEVSRVVTSEAFRSFRAPLTIILTQFFLL